MTPIEFLHRMKQLPADTQLNFHQVIAAFDMLSPMLDLSHPPHDPALHAIHDEQGLAEWLNEPASTVEAWHGEDSHYRLSPVLEWVDRHLVSIGSMIDAGADEFRIGEKVAPYFEEWLPCLLIENQYVEYFDSLGAKGKPNEHRIFRTDVLALETTRMSKQKIDDVMQSFEALGDFRSMIASSASGARNIYEAWKDKAVPEVLEQFLVVALGHDHGLATEISNALENPIDLKRFKLAAWLWEKWMLKCSGLKSVDIEGAIAFVTSRGVSVNQHAQVLDSRGAEVFQGTAAHLLADTMGDEFRLPPLHAGCDSLYGVVLARLLDLGLDIKKPNNRKLTACEIANKVEAKHGSGTSPFKEMVGNFEDNKGLSKTLSTKSEQSRSRPTSI